MRRVSERDGRSARNTWCLVCMKGEQATNARDGDEAGDDLAPARTKFGRANKRNSGAEPHPSDHLPHKGCEQVLEGALMAFISLVVAGAFVVGVQRISVRMRFESAT
jgi:hypothetical protein